jgi:methyltransferase (TIGR00027 family)
MLVAKPSETALRVAAHRAAHQVLENGAIFTDPYASKVLGTEAEALIARAAADPSMRSMRIMFAARSRYAEDSLREAVKRGTRQIVILGAGLDTFALRNPYQDEKLRVFEVDHPATQRWKQDRLRDLGLSPPMTQYVPVDFETTSLGIALDGAGFDISKAAFFYWLGVVMYLRESAAFDTLQFVASLQEAEIVFDYTEPFENYPADRQAFMLKVAERAAQAGEPWLTFFDPKDLSQRLGNLGFDEQEDLGLAEFQARYRFQLGGSQMSGSVGPHVIRARKATSGCAPSPG